MRGGLESNLVSQPETSRKPGCHAHIRRRRRAGRLEEKAICETLTEHDRSNEARVLAAGQVGTMQDTRKAQSVANGVREFLVGQIEQFRARAIVEVVCRHPGRPIDIDRRRFSRRDLDDGAWTNEPHLAVAGPFADPVAAVSGPAGSQMVAARTRPFIGKYVSAQRGTR